MATIKTNNQWTSATRCKISKKNALYLSLISLSDSISGFVATSCFVVVTECQNSTIQLESCSCRQPWEDDDPGRRSTAIPVANSYRWIVYLGILFVSWLDKSIKKSKKVPLSIIKWSMCHYFFNGQRLIFCLGIHNNKPHCLYNGWKRHEQSAVEIW